MRLLIGGRRAGRRTIITLAMCSYQFAGASVKCYEYKQEGLRRASIHCSAETLSASQGRTGPANPAIFQLAWTRESLL
ncbi:unnamed protein product [Leptosia nina]|uniref:Secreted protein n=1 Tax=Leptosia nina TaxID=320188 RepID=A0AAV1JD08_9NEOP